MDKPKVDKRRRLFQRLDSGGILLLLLFTVFGIPIFNDALERTLYDLAIILIFGWLILNASKQRSMILGVVLIALAARWIVAPLVQAPWLAFLAGGINVLVFAYAVVQLILEMARVQEVRTDTLLDAISGYLLLGLAYSSLIGYLYHIDPGSFHFNDQQDLQLADFNYFGFVTLTTLGYGDITPQTDVARSIATLGSVAGQLYIAVIVALLVSKLGKEA